MSPDFGNLGQRWRLIRFNPLRSLTPEKLSSALDAWEAGWLRDAALIYETIEKRDAIVRSVMTKRRSSVARRDWQVVIPDEENPNAEAHKATLEYFYNNLTVTDATDLNVRTGMSGLIRQMMDAIIQRYSVHEIVWQPGPQGLTAELRRVPIYFFENRTGRLRFTGPEARADGVPLDENGWMITVADGLGEALSICYMYKRLGLQDWLAFSEKFSIPGVLGRTSAAQDSDEGRALAEAVVAYASEWVGVVYNDDGTIKDPISTVQVEGSGSALPQEKLSQYMDRMIAALVRGADLGTLSQGDSQGASLQGEETDALLEDDCALVSETLQTQLDRLIIRMVHGDDTPAAYVVVNPPSNQDLKTDLEIDKGLKELGVTQDPADLAERYGREMAEAKTETPESETPEVDPAPNESTEGDDALAAILAALSDDLQPLGEALAGALQAGDAPAMQAALRKISERMPEFLEGGAMADLLSDEMVQALLGEDDAAENTFNPTQSRDLMGRWNGSAGGGGHPAIGKVGSWQALGLPSTSDISADAASSVSDIVRAKLALERGIPVNDVFGTPITFGPAILAHWQTEGKPPAEQDRRLRRLSDAVRSVTSPHEVWENSASGQRTYLRKFKEGAGSFTVSGFVADRSGQIHSYFHDRRNTSINKRRTGRLLSKR